MSQIQAIRGFNDVLPPITEAWAYLETQLRVLAEQYGYHEIRLPILEKTELFVRSVGEVTDIVEKEMYTFTDSSQNSLSLRPEGTAGCLRAAIEHGLMHNQIQRLWYMGPMFRHERPQAGRYRQFYHAGFEVYGLADAYIDAELIMMTARLWRRLGLLDDLNLQINTLGTASSRQTHRKALVDYFTDHFELLDEDSKKRLQRNPLRILDSKNPHLRTLIANAPKIIDYLDSESLAYFDCLQNLLTDNHIRFEVNHTLVRGLDYYSHAVFEWVSTQLGAQGTVCAGGRYDGLTKDLGAKPTPAVGFAMGMERILLLLEAKQLLPPVKTPWLYVLSMDTTAKNVAMHVAEMIRNEFVSEQIVNDTSLSSFKTQMKRADKSGATLALIIGEDEVKADTISVKFLRATMSQQSIPRTQLIEFLRTHHGL